MVVLGAGMAGCLAAIAFPDAIIHELQPEPNVHKAVLRFRSDVISKMTGIPFKEVTVHKAIFTDGGFASLNPRLANQYSKKVTGGFSDRSIWNQGAVQRWIAPKDFHQQLLDIVGERVVLGSDIDLNDMPFNEVVISTLPMPVMSEVFNMPANCSQDFSSIYVTTIIIDNCDLYQTVYFPDSEVSIYRLTIEGSRAIVESNSEIGIDEACSVITALGITSKTVDCPSINHKQKIGKIPAVESNSREDFVFDLTDKFNIYSLGRSAIWRNILLDDVAHDIKKIKEMMAKTKYQRNIG